MTHSEPASAITTMTTVKISAIMRPAALRRRVHVQEVDHVHDDLHRREAPG